MEYLILFVLATFIPPTVVAGFPMDIGMGKCPMDQFYSNPDELCHRNSDGSPVHILPKSSRGALLTPKQPIPQLTTPPQP